MHTSASSTLHPEEGNTYVAANTVDGDPQTAWSEGRDGPGIGASITWTFRRPVDLRRVNIVNGYAKGDLFATNLRMRAASVSTAQGVTTATVIRGADISEAIFSDTDVDPADFSGAREQSARARWPVGTEPPTNLSGAYGAP